VDLDVVDGEGGEPGPGPHHRLLGPIDRDHRAARSDQPGEHQADVASARAEVEHAHAGAYPGPGQHLLGQRVEEVALPLEALELVVGVAEDVRVGVGGHASLTRARRPGTPVECARSRS